MKAILSVFFLICTAICIAQSKDTIHVRSQAEQCNCTGHTNDSLGTGEMMCMVYIAETGQAFGGNYVLKVFAENGKLSFCVEGKGPYTRIKAMAGGKYKLVLCSPGYKTMAFNFVSLPAGGFRQVGFSLVKEGEEKEKRKIVPAKKANEKETERSEF